MKKFTGKVVSTKMQKSVVIEREMTRIHPMYKKILKKYQRIKAHTDMALVTGDMVEVESVKPFSKDIHFKVIRKVEKL